MCEREKMTTIELNREQISELIRYKEFELDDYSKIEIFDDEIILNEKGTASYLSSVIFEYIEPDTDDEDMFMRYLICEHLNLEPTNVICISFCSEEGVFRVRFSPECELTMIVCPVNMAVQNTENFIHLTNQKNSEMEQIGVYKRLGHSAYFFRWDI